MSDPRRAEVWGKKAEVADRTLNERKYCKVCDYYYSEMFTCPICYGAARENERIIKLLEDFYDGDLWRQTGATSYVGFDIVELIELIKGEQK